jgi:hypothetical protein
VLGGKARSFDDQTPKGLPPFQPGLRACLSTKIDDPSHVRDVPKKLDIRLLELGPAGEMDGRRPVRHEVPPEMLGQERHHRRDHAKRLDERVPQGSERRLVVRVEAPPRQADVPIRHVVYEIFERPYDIDGERRLVGVGRFYDKLLRPLGEPAVQRAQVASRLESRPGRREPLDVSVVDQELGGVPECEQLALDLTPRAVAEPEILRGGLLAVLPAHDIGAHLRKRVLGLDHVAP